VVDGGRFGDVELGGDRRWISSLRFMSAIDFLFDAHRLNVAISRAQCLAVLVHSPRLLDADCNSLEAMALVDGACRFLELATPIDSGG